MEAFDFNKLINPNCNNLLNRNFMGDNAFTFEHKGSSDVADMTNVVNVLKNGALKTNTKFKNNVNPFLLELKTTKAGDKSLDFVALIPKVKGMTLGAYLENKIKTGTNFNLSTQYCHGACHGRFEVEPLNRKMTVFGLGKLNLDFGRVLLGAHFNFDFKSKNLNYTVATAYDTKLNEANLIASLRFKGANFKPFHPSLVSDVVFCTTKGGFRKGVGAEAEYFFPDNKVTFNIGAVWYLTPPNCPKPSLIKAKLNHDYKAEVALTHALTDNLTVTLSSQGMVAKDFNPQDVKLGFKVALK